jgi:hypothetical protein
MRRVIVRCAHELCSVVVPYVAACARGQPTCCDGADRDRRPVDGAVLISAKEHSHMCLNINGVMRARVQCVFDFSRSFSRNRVGTQLLGEQRISPECVGARGRGPRGGYWEKQPDLQTVQ